MRGGHLGPVLLAVALVVAGPTAAAAPGLGQVDPDDVLLAIDLHADGNATWTVEYRIDLETENETAAFEELQDDIAADPAAYEADFAAGIRESVRLAENRTGREMAVREVDVSTRRAPSSTFEGRGIVTYTFTWTNFARTNDTTIRAGDAISGFYLDNRSTLQVTWPDGYRVATVTPPDDTAADRTGVVVWHGETEFSAAEPRLTLTRATPTRSPTATTADDAGGVPGDVPSAPAGVVAVLALAGVGWVLLRREPGGAGSGAEPGAAAGGGSEGSPPTELLSNEERVVATLADNGGRMKQQELAERLDWTAPKTSKVVGELREADEVDVFRLGRENVVTLPGEGLTDE